MNLGNILVATDFSEAARRAEQRGARLAQALDAQLRLIHVLPDEGVLGRIFDHNDVDAAQMRRCAEHALETACAKIDAAYDIDASWQVLAGGATRSINRAIDAFSADLVVIGARGEHGLSRDRTTLGGTALKLLAQCKIPLLLVRRMADDAYGKVVMSVSTEATARRMLDVVQSLCGNAECHLVHVSEAPFAERLRRLDISRGAIETYSQEQFAAAERLIERLIGESPVKDRLHPMVVRGNPSSATLREIGRLEPDLVAIGKHDGRVPQNRDTDAGSVAMRIAMRAYCDILQIP